jgi:hypothetical protein
MRTRSCLRVLLAACAVLAACRPAVRPAPASLPPLPPLHIAGADSVVTEVLTPAVRLHRVTWLPTDTRPGPWRAAVLELDLAGCVSLAAVKGAPTAVGRTTTSALLAAVPAERRAIAAVNADFFSFTPTGVPTGLHVEDGTVVAGPGGRPAFVVDSAGRPHVVVPAVQGLVRRGADSVSLAAWNRWPAAGLTLLDARWGVPLDSTAEGATVVAAVHLGAATARYRVVPGGDRRTARGDTALLVLGAPASGPDDNAAARRFLAALGPGDTLTLGPRLGPVVPREAVGGFPELLAAGEIPAALATAGAASFRGVNPRTAVGWDAAGRRLLLVVIDGRRADWSVGTTTAETAAVMRALGASEALNLDGGGSSALAVREAGNGAVRVVTRPSDPTGERAVGNGLAVLDGCGR